MRKAKKEDGNFYNQPWTTADDRGLDTLDPSTLEYFKLLLKARACSAGVDRSERPSKFIGILRQEYSLGPLDENGVPLRFTRTIN